MHDEPNINKGQTLKCYHISFHFPFLFSTLWLMGLTSLHFVSLLCSNNGCGVSITSFLSTWAIAFPIHKEYYFPLSSIRAPPDITKYIFFINFFTPFLDIISICIIISPSNSFWIAQKCIKLFPKNFYKILPKSGTTFNKLDLKIKSRRNLKKKYHPTCFLL